MVRRSEMESKMRLVDKITKQLENDFEKSKSQFENISKNLELIDGYVNTFKAEVNSLEKQTVRENDHKSKLLVRMKISLDNVSREFD